MNWMNIKKGLGYFLLLLSMLLWPVVFAVPFFDWSAAKIAGVITFLIISAEVCFLLAVLLLGKEVWLKMKAFMQKKIAELREQG